MIIESGTGNGRQAGVDGDNRLLTAAFNIPFPHLIAKDYQKTFIVSGTTGTMQAAPNSLLYLENSNDNQVIVLNRIILQANTSSTLATAGDYFTLELASEYASGGTSVTPVNLSSGSAVTSGARCYEGAFALTGAPQVAETVWAINRQPIVLTIEGGVTVLPGKGISIGYTSTTSGVNDIAKASVAFSVVSVDGYSG